MVAAPEKRYSSSPVASVKVRASKMRLPGSRPYSPHTMSWMGVPLRTGTTVLGVLSVQSYALDAFTPEDLEFLELLAVQLGIVMENAALHEQLEREANTDPLTGLLNRRAFLARTGVGTAALGLGGLGDRAAARAAELR